MIWLANISPRAFAVYVVVYSMVFIVLMQVVNLYAFYGVPPEVLVSRGGLARVVQRLRTATGTSHPDITMLDALNRYPRLGLPFAGNGDPAVERYVLSRRQLQPEYYVSVVGVYTAAALERKLRDVGKAEYLLVPGGGLTSRGSSNPCAGYLKRLREWFLYPANFPCRADPLDPSGSLKSFITAHYVPIEKVGSWTVLRRISSASPSRDDQ